MAYQPSELLTLANQLRLLMEQGIPEDEAKESLRKLFELEGRSIYSPKYIVSYEAALIDWATGQVALRRLPRQVFTPTLTAAAHFAHFPERGSGDTAEVPVTENPSADQQAPEASPGAINRKPAVRTASSSSVKAVIRKRGAAPEAELQRAVREALPNKHVPRGLVRQVREELFGKPVSDAQSRKSRRNKVAEKVAGFNSPPPRDF